MIGTSGVFLSSMTGGQGGGCGFIFQSFFTAFIFPIGKNNEDKNICCKDFRQEDRDQKSN